MILIFLMAPLWTGENPSIFNGPCERVSMSGVSNRQVYAYALFLMITSPLFSYFFTPKHNCSSHNLLYVFGYFPRSLSSCSSLINNTNSISPYYLKKFNLHLKYLKKKWFTI